MIKILISPQMSFKNDDIFLLNDKNWELKCILLRIHRFE